MVIIDKEKCIGCGQCVSDCSVYNIKLIDGKAEIKRECFECGHCVAICPQNAVTIPELDMDDVEACNTTIIPKPEQILNLIKSRRSIRGYREQKIDKDSLSMLLQAGRYTATAKNNQDCHFVFVQNELDEVKRQVWDFVDNMQNTIGGKITADIAPYISFNRRRKADPSDDYLFRNAPVVLFITSDWPVDAGLAAQNIETMAVTLGLGALYNGFLARIVDENEELKKWLGIEGKQIKACMLLGYPDRKYQRTAPRKKANVIWK